MLKAIEVEGTIGLHCNRPEAGIMGILYGERRVRAQSSGDALEKRGKQDGF